MKTILSLAFSLILIGLNAQLKCDYVGDTSITLSAIPANNCYKFLDDLIPKTSDSAVEINVTIWIFADNHGLNCFVNDDSTSIKNMIQTANYSLAHLSPAWNYPSNNPNVADSRIKFRVKNYHRVNDSLAYYSRLVPGTGHYYNYDSIYRDPLSLNIYFLYRKSTGGFGASELRSLSIRIYANEGDTANPLYPAPEPRDLSSRSIDIVHELGHQLGLEHPYSGQGGGYAAIKDPFYCCTVATQTDVMLQSASDFTSVSGSCALTTIPPNLTNNIMSYNWQCKNSLTPHQLAIMHYYLLPEPILGALTNAGYRNGVNVNLSSNDTISNIIEHWDKDRFIKGNIIIPAGKTLSITCRVHMQHRAFILVKPGGKLVVNGGTITNLINTKWKGIYVEGNPNLDQSYNSSTGLYNNQGFALLLHASIENADTGICNYGPNGISFSSTGGVIKADQTSFINNQVDVQFHPYLSNNYESEFLACNFKTNDLVRDMDQPEIHLNIWACNNIVIDGCTFENNAHYHHPYKGLGIFSTDAIYNVTGNPNSYISKFIGLEKGIAAFNMGALSSINVYKAKFIDNKRSIELTKANTSQITECDFKLDSFQIGLHVVNSKHWLAEGNRFHGSAGAGMWLTSNGNGNHRVYKNYFDSLPSAVVIQYNNSGLYNSTDGLKLNCNTFSLTNRDVIMLGASGSGANDFSSASVNAEQGVVTSPSSPSAIKLARNRYGANCSNQNKWFLNGSLTKLIQHGNNSDAVCQVTPQPACSNSLLVVSVAQLTLDFNNHCADNGLRKPNAACACNRCCLKNEIDGGISDTKNELNALIAHKDSVLDGGNTTSLLNEISTYSLSHAAIRDLLLSYSPYLSDTVLNAYFSSSSVSQAYFAKIHAANAPVSSAVLTTILSNSLPPHIVDNIEVQQAQLPYSQREALNMTISDATFNLHALYAEKLNYFLHDTLPAAKDSLVPFIRNNMSDMAGFTELLPEAYFKSGNKIRAIEVADSLAAIDTYSANATLSAKKLRMDSLFCTGSFFNPIDSAYFEALNTDTSSVGCWESRALFNRLHRRDMRFFFLEVEDAAGVRKSRNRTDLEPTISIQQEKFTVKLYPNPSKGSFIIESTSYTSNSTYSIYDLLGRKIIDGKVHSNKTVVDVNVLPPGVYTCQIQLDADTTNNFKIIIQK